MELAYLLNNSPDFFGEQPHGSHWATYELNGETVDGETGVFGTVRVHDDYWHLDSEDRRYYNFNVRNSLKLSRADFEGFRHFTEKYDNCALLLHAQNVEEVYRYASRRLRDSITVIGAYMGIWRNDLEYWAMREYNTIMEDDANANYSGVDHRFPGIHGVVNAFAQKRRADNAWLQRLIHNTDYQFAQDNWQRLEQIPELYRKLGIQAPGARWIQDYYTTFQSRQEYNIPQLVELRMEHDARQE